jgi:hypothetical protein
MNRRDNRAKAFIVGRVKTLVHLRTRDLLSAGDAHPMPMLAWRRRDQNGLRRRDDNLFPGAPAGDARRTTKAAKQEFHQTPQS